MPKFPCPLCREERGGEAEPCSVCGWAPRPPAKQPHEVCPFCDGERFAWGEVKNRQVEQSLGLRFVPDSAGIYERALGAGDKVRARRCLDCHNVQLFAES